MKPSQCGRSDAFKGNPCEPWMKKNGEVISEDQMTPQQISEYLWGYDEYERDLLEEYEEGWNYG